jgi:sterol desaturase/sphingolipid hydroxylase (fatty acid hydroxylase superfamily)
MQVAYLVGTIAVLDVLDDTWFYWIHLLMHRWKWLYMRVHAMHHKYAELLGPGLGRRDAAIEPRSASWPVLAAPSCSLLARPPAAALAFAGRSLQPPLPATPSIWWRRSFRFLR